MSPKTTPFVQQHILAGARLIEFGGWNMPVHYSGVLEEHRLVREHAGLFDVSHMGEIEVSGRQAGDYIQYLITNDITQCRVQQAQYAILCRQDGGIVDDIIIYRLADDHFLCCVNASNTDKDFDWMSQVAASFDVQVTNRSADYAQLAIQGPDANAIVQSLTSFDLLQLRFRDCARIDVADIPMIVARTGYTGEDGFEIFFAPDQAARAWENLMAAGHHYGMKPIGLGARDTLRLEMKYSLYGNDIDDSTSPLEAGLGWAVKLQKENFLGRHVLVEQKRLGVSRKLVGFELLERGVPRHGYRMLDEAGNHIGQVTSGAISPTLNRPIGMAYVPTALSTLDSSLFVEIRQKSVPARVVKTPFVTSGRK